MSDHPDTSAADELREENVPERPWSGEETLHGGDQTVGIDARDEDPSAPADPTLGLLAALTAGVAIDFYRVDGYDDVTLPGYAHDGDAGLDVFPRFREARQTLAPGAWAKYPTGLGVAHMPAGVAILVAPRSGLADKLGITIGNSPGVVDASYRGEIKLIVINHSDRSVTIERDVALGQLLVMPVFRAVPRFVTGPTETTRGGNGFGSTGS